MASNTGSNVLPSVLPSVPGTVSKRPAAPHQRLDTPLVREAGALRPASWDEALARAADGLRRNVARLGPDGVGMFSCSKATNEVNFAAQKFMRSVIGTHNIDSCNRT